VAEMAMLGFLATDVYLLTVDEINTMIQERSVHEIELSVSSAWRTINFLGSLLADKFKNLDRYMPETPKRKKADDERKRELEEKLSKIM
jgi:hypothetical protein